MENNAAVPQPAETPKPLPPVDRPKWTYDKVDMPGPLQYKKTVNAIRAIHSEAGAFRSGRESAASSVVIYEIFCVNPRQDCVIAAEDLGRKYNWTITKSNHKKIQADAAAALATLKANRPVKEGL